MIKKFFRYGLVQGIGYIIDFSVFFVMVKLGAGIIIANSLSKIAAAVFCFFAHKIYTFEVGKKVNLHEVMLYIMALFVNIFVASVLLLFFVKYLPLNFAKISSDICCVGINFFISHYLIFRIKKK